MSTYSVRTVVLTTWLTDGFTDDSDVVVIMNRLQLSLVSDYVWKRVLTTFARSVTIQKYGSDKTRVGPYCVCLQGTPVSRLFNVAVTAYQSHDRRVKTIPFHYNLRRQSLWCDIRTWVRAAFGGCWLRPTTRNGNVFPIKMLFALGAPSQSHNPRHRNRLAGARCSGCPASNTVDVSVPNTNPDERVWSCSLSA